jgi:hypothetical protein
MDSNPGSRPVQLIEPAGRASPLISPPLIALFNPEYQRRYRGKCCLFSSSNKRNYAAALAALAIAPTTGVIIGSASITAR